MTTYPPNQDPHQDQPILAAGEPLSRAQAAVIMVHGRGATPEDILTLVPAIDPGGIAYLAPAAANNTWYPNSFLAPIASNEPGLSSALRVISRLLAKIADTGLPTTQTMLLGFSQGACLVVEYAARQARQAQQFGGVAGLSGGLIGPEGSPRDYTGTLANTPVFLGCSDVDPHIPLARVRETTTVLENLGAQVTERIYPNMGHLVNEDEIAHVRQMLEALRNGTGA